MKINGKAIVIEDNFVIAMDAASSLEELTGAEVLMANSVPKAEQMIASEPQIGFALLDVRLGDDISIDIARNLVERQIPFAISTGYSVGEDVLMSYPSAPMLKKPFSKETLAAVLDEVLG